MSVAALNRILAKEDKENNQSLLYLLQTLGAKRLFEANEFNDIRDALGYLDTKPSTPINNITEIPNRSYNHLQNLPTIPTAITNLNQIATRSYNDLQNLPTPNVFVDSTPSADVTGIIEELVKTYNIGTLTGKKMIEFTALAHKIGSATADLRLHVYLHNTVTNTSVSLGQAVSLTTSQFLGKQNTIAIDGNTIRQLLSTATGAPSVYNWYSVNITESTIVASDTHQIRVFIRNGQFGSGIKLFMFKYEIQ
jgi:hypothetical protein